MTDAKWARATACGLALAAVTACSTTPQVPSGLASASQPMAASPYATGTLVWKKPGLNQAAYTSFIINPIDVYRGPDAQFGSGTDTQALAADMDRQFRQSLGERYRITNTPGPNTARLQLTLVGTTNNVPVVATTTRIAPVGIVTNVMRASTGGTPTFTGTVTVEGQFFDSRTGERLATFVTTQAPSAMDLGATLTSQDAQQAAVAVIARDLRDALERAQAAAVPAG